MGESVLTLAVRLVAPLDEADAVLGKLGKGCTPPQRSDDLRRKLRYGCRVREGRWLGMAMQWGREGSGWRCSEEGHREAMDAVRKGLSVELMGREGAPAGCGHDMSSPSGSRRRWEGL